MWSGIIIIIGMVLTALVTFTAIAVWYAIRKQEIEVEKMRAKVKPVSLAEMLSGRRRHADKDEEDDDEDERNR